MLFVKFAGAFAALLLASNVASAQGTKLTDPQVAHIAYTAGQLDIQAAQQAEQKSKNKDVIAFAKELSCQSTPAMMFSTGLLQSRCCLLPKSANRLCFSSFLSSTAGSHISSKNNRRLSLLVDVCSLTFAR